MVADALEFMEPPVGVSRAKGPEVGKNARLRLEKRKLTEDLRQAQNWRSNVRSTPSSCTPDLSYRPNPNIAVTRGSLTDEIVPAAAKTSDFLEVSTKYIAIETDFAANFCDTCLSHIHRRSNRRKNLRVLQTNPASCLPMSNFQLGDKLLGILKIGHRSQSWSRVNG